MPGPPPNPHARRRNVRPDATLLPPNGYEGDVPEWPLSGRKKPAEIELWKTLWATPQAAAWVVMGEGTSRTIARYCRLSLIAESADAPATIHGEVRQLEDRLGLTPMSMRRLMWDIAADETAEKRDEAAASGVRARLSSVKAVDDAVAGT
jgi:hypothetical protein